MPCRTSTSTGYGLYEYRFRRDGKQVDYPLWVHLSRPVSPSRSRVAQYEMDQQRPVAACSPPSGDSGEGTVVSPGGGGRRVHGD